jgi:hypothetical protein
MRRRLVRASHPERIAVFGFFVYRVCIVTDALMSVFQAT